MTKFSLLWRGQYIDLVKELIPSRPEQVWVADITYFRTKDDLNFTRICAVPLIGKKFELKTKALRHESK